MGKAARAALEIHGSISSACACVPGGWQGVLGLAGLHCKGGEAGLMSSVVRDLTGAFHRRVIGVALGWCRSGIRRPAIDPWAQASGLGPPPGFGDKLPLRRIGRKRQMTDEWLDDEIDLCGEPAFYCIRR